MRAFAVFGLLLALLPPGRALAVSYTLASEEDSVFGSLTTIRTDGEDTLLDVARRYGLGYHDMKLSNPDVDTWLPGEGTEVVLPTEFVLPYGKREGIILNVPEMRLYYFPPRKGSAAPEVLTFPVGIGREGWTTPYVSTRVIQKKERPSWFPPESIRAEHAAMGDPLPRRVGPGPDNPLGEYAMRLGLPDYLIHGTNKPWGVGMRVSHGCVRLYPEDIKELFRQVKVGTPVNIVNQPYKVGLRGGRLFLEAHPYLKEDEAVYKDNLTSVVKLVVANTEEGAYEVDWDLVRAVVENPRGIPVEIGHVRRDEPPLQMATGDDAAPAALRLRMETELGSPPVR
jgi:L,D-transpeptidase ErfK/SrfK